MSAFRYEFVGDINTTYPYIEVFRAGQAASFMDVGVNDAKQIEFRI
jgi:hypothetical protein